jgi:hypothetical protein
MAIAENPMIGADTRMLNYTIPLTEAAESEAISPDEYARRRASLVGENNILEYIIIPLFLALWHRLFRSDKRKTVLVKSKLD